MSIVKSSPPPRPRRPAQQHRLLVVDGERGAARAISDVVADVADCHVVSARNLAEARKVLARENVTLLVTEVRLSDGSGLSLVDDLRKASPSAGVVVTARAPKLDDAVEAMRCGAADFIAKPISADLLAQRIKSALVRQDTLARHERKIARLREAVRRLAEARRTVAQKVDLLCNDLVGAYGELSRQVDSVRTQEDFRKLCDRSKDLEQLLCHAMDWIMRRTGYSNIAVFLAADDPTASGGGFQLGAYVKYTLASSPELTEAVRDGLVQRAGREGFVKLTADESARELTAAELRHLRDHAVLAANCTYLGESLATIVLFRDGNSPFSSEDGETFKAIAPVFAIALAGQVKGGSSGNDGDDQGDSGDVVEPTDQHNPDGDAPPPPRSKRDDRSDADWWKRGEAPPF